MESLVKFTQEGLEIKSDIQLRQVLRRDFQFSKGTSVMSHQQLINQILELVELKNQNIQDNFGIDEELVHVDTVGAEWKIDRIEGGVVYVYTKDRGVETNVTVKGFLTTFTAKRHVKFSERTEHNSHPLVETINDRPQHPSASTEVEQIEDKSELSKSDKVRIIIAEQYNDEDVKMTSGTVMKELKQRYGEEIHRSFASTLMRTYIKAQQSQLKNE